MLVFLKVNNIIINCQDDDIIELGFGIASGTSYIMEWIISHCLS